MTGPARSPRAPATAHWVRASTLGWLVGFVLILGLSLAWDLVGGGAQFMVGVGMGAGVGYVQGRALDGSIPVKGAWIGGSVAGMGAPFVLWDVVGPFGLESLFSLPACVAAGGVLTGVLQARTLGEHSRRAAWWIPVCAVGWMVPALAIALGDVDLGPGPWGLISLTAMVIGGMLLGLVTARPLGWILSAEGADPGAGGT